MVNKIIKNPQVRLNYKVFLEVYKITFFPMPSSGKN